MLKRILNIHLIKRDRSHTKEYQYVKIKDIFIERSILNKVN